jgi:uncharacterized membrane protein YfcA
VLSQASTGFGFSVMATPFLLLVFAASDAIQINIILTILISAVLLPKLVADVDWGLCKKLVMGSLLGAPVGLLIFLVANADYLRAAIGGILLTQTFLIILRFRIARTGMRDMIIGGLSGIFTGGLGMLGPPLRVYFAGTGMAPRVLRSTSMVFFLFIYSLILILILILQILAGSPAGATFTTALYMTPAAAVGVIAGRWLFRRINPAVFMALIYALILVMGAYLVGGRRSRQVNETTE